MARKARKKRKPIKRAGSLTGGTMGVGTIMTPSKKKKPVRRRKRR